MKQFTILISLIIAGTSSLYGQSIENLVISSVGKQLSGGGFTIEYTLGEVATSTLVKSNFIITQGFHQPKLLVARVMEESDTIENEEELPNQKERPAFTDNYSVEIYPNPVTDYVNIVINAIPSSKCFVILTDSQGRIIKSTQIKESQFRVEFEHLAAGKYMLGIRSEDGLLNESFRILKSK